MIALCEPNLGKLEQEYVAQAITSGWVGPDGPHRERFETMVAKAAKRKWAVATTTGTAAIEAAATVLAFHDQTVKVPIHTFPAMRHVLRRLGCEVFPTAGGENHDVYRYSYSSWPVIADCAPAIGEKPTTATVECYSFAANKIVTCGQGGAVVGDDPSLHEAIRTIIKQGYGRKGLFNYRMANINAALGCAQMQRLDELKEAKRRIWTRYKDAGLPMMERGASRWMATIETPGAPRPMELLAASDIMAREEAGGISIPCSTGLTEADQDLVIKTIKLLL